MGRKLIPDIERWYLIAVSGIREILDTLSKLKEEIKHIKGLIQRHENLIQRCNRQKKWIQSSSSSSGDQDSHHAEIPSPNEVSSSPEHTQKGALKSTRRGLKKCNDECLKRINKYHENLSVARYIIQEMRQFEATLSEKEIRQYDFDVDFIEIEVNKFKPILSFEISSSESESSESIEVENNRVDRILSISKSSDCIYGAHNNVEYSSLDSRVSRKESTETAEDNFVEYSTLDSRVSKKEVAETAEDTSSERSESSPRQS